MLWTGRAPADDSVVVRRVGETSWILRPRASLQGRTLDALRRTFLDAADSGAQNVVIDLSDADMISREGAATLGAMAELMLGRGGLLWLAASWTDRPGHTLRPIEELEHGALVGLTRALDTALEELSPDPAANGALHGDPRTEGVER